MRTRDATVHNIIANHPDVISWLEWNPADHPETDGFMLLDHLAQDDNYVLLHNGDRDILADDLIENPNLVLPTLALIFEWSAPGIWQVHTMAHPDARGNLIDDAKAMMHQMFVEHGADMIWGQTPLHNIRARKFNAKIGAETCGTGHHFVAGEVEYFRNSRARWLADHWNAPPA